MDPPVPGNEIKVRGPGSIVGRKNYTFASFLGRKAALLYIERDMWETTWRYYSVDSLRQVIRSRFGDQDL